MYRVILASHGDMAKGAKVSLEMIIGEQEGLTAYGLYPGENPADYAAELEKEIQAAPKTKFFIVTDLAAASVCNAMFPLSRYPNVWVFTGFNLQFLLELLSGEPESMGQEEIDQLLDSARQGMKQLTFEIEEEEDF
ncbi:MAG: PTS sugar transporter subunit IIA [Faecousia sp.]